MLIHSLCEHFMHKSKSSCASFGRRMMELRLCFEVFCRQKRPIGRIFCSRAVFLRFFSPSKGFSRAASGGASPAMDFPVPGIESPKPATENPKGGVVRRVRSIMVRSGENLHRPDGPLGKAVHFTSAQVLFRSKCDETAFIIYVI